MMRKEQLCRRTGFLWFFLFILCALQAGAVQAQLSPETQAKIRAVLSSPKLQDAQVGLSILELGTVEDKNQFPAKNAAEKPFRVLFEKDARKRFMPASNMKLFTAAIALHLLGKERTFPTQVFQRGAQLFLIGGGDPSFKTSDLEKIAAQIAARKTGAISSIIGDGTLFTGSEIGAGKFPYGWTVDDTLWYYGPAVSALAFERNHFDLLIQGGSADGTPARLTASSPLASVFRIENAVNSRKQGTSTEPIRFVWGPERTLFVCGETTIGKKSSLGVAFPDPAEFAAAALENLLRQRGVLTQAAVSSQSPSGGRSTLNYKRTSDSKSTFDVKKGVFELAGSQKVAEHNSLPLEVLLGRLLKNSDNLYAELLLRDAAVYKSGVGDHRNAAAHAHELLKVWLNEQGIETDALRFEDGSGLSRYNLLTPRATSELLAAINAMPEGDAIWNALPIAGVDGTLRNRMKSTLAAGNVRAKTGTFSIASNLSGYVTTHDNQRLAVSFYVNFARDVQTMRWAQDAIFTALAENRR